MKNKFLLAVLFTVIGFGVFAQKQAATANQASPLTHIETLQAFYTNINSYFLSKSPNLDQVTKYMSPSFFFIRNSENVSGKVSNVKWNSEEYLRDLKGTKDLNLYAERSIIKVTFERAIGNLANISAIIKVRYKQDTTVVSEGYAYTSHSIVKENGEWKIANMTTDRVTENQTIGVCPCKITRTVADRNDMYSAKVMYPNGSSFETEDHQISFKGEGPISIVTFGSNYYTWKENMVYTAKIDGQQDASIVGKAMNQNEVITLILAKSMYKNQCIRFEPIK
jgi:hypothetical protein